MPVPPCAYCGAPLVHLMNGPPHYERMWVVFYRTKDGSEASVVKWQMHEPFPVGRVEADRFICSRRRTHREV